jgi:hypothetical protein
MVYWRKAELELVKEILREAEVNLQGQLSLAIAADQRSSVMASLFTAAAAAIVAGLITLASTDNASHPIAIYTGGAVAAMLLAAGASLCIWAARPINFYVPGNEPKSWYGDIANPRELKVLLGEQAEVYQEMIDDNMRTLSKNSQRFIAGAMAGMAAPLAGFVVWGGIRLYLD